MSLGSGFRNTDGSGLVKLAAKQHGAVSMGQLEALGYSRWAVHRLVDRRHLHRLFKGVYAVGHTRLNTRGHWMAAVLACGEGSVLSHYCAAALWGLQRAPTTRIDVTSPGNHRLAGICSHKSRALPQQDRAVIDAIPLTSLNRTVLDLALDLSPQRLRTILEAAQRRDLLDIRTLNALIARSTGHHGTKPMKAALAELHDEAPWTQSELERRFLELIRAQRLPVPDANVLVSGQLVDFYWAKHRLVVEVDGYEFHRTRRAFEEDRRRDRRLQLTGEHVVRITHRQLEYETRELIADLRRVLGSTAA